MLAIRCDKCDSEFPITERRCPHCGDRVKLSSKFYCGNCNKPFNIHEGKCKYCNEVPKEVSILTKSGKIIKTKFESTDKCVEPVDEYVYFERPVQEDMNLDPNVHLVYFIYTAVMIILSAIELNYVSLVIFAVLLLLVINKYAPLLGLVGAIVLLTSLPNVVITSITTTYIIYTIIVFYSRNKENKQK